jgi:hypothetical protein
MGSKSQFLLYAFTIFVVMLAYLLAIEPPSFQISANLKERMDQWLEAEWVKKDPMPAEWRKQLELDLEDEVLRYYVPELADVGENRTISVPGLYYSYKPPLHIMKLIAESQGVPHMTFVRYGMLIKARRRPIDASGFEKGGDCHIDQKFVIPRTRINFGIYHSSIILCEPVPPGGVSGDVYPDMCNDCEEKVYPLRFEASQYYHKHGAGRATIMFEFTPNTLYGRASMILMDVILRGIHISATTMFADRNPNTDPNTPKDWRFVAQVAGRNTFRNPITDILWALGLSNRY